MKTHCKYFLTIGLTLLRILFISILCIICSDACNAATKEKAKSRAFVGAVTVGGVTYGCMSNHTAYALGMSSSSTLTDIVIPEYVTRGNEKYEVDRIGNSCFKDSKLESVVIDASLEEIGNNAFYNCRNLTYVDGGAKRIGTKAFSNCPKLTQVNLPSHVDVIDRCAFMNDSSLQHVTFPQLIDTIHEDAFANCVNLQEIELGTVGYLELSAFYHDTAIQSVYIDNLKSCDVNAFMRFDAKSQVKTVTIKGGMVGDAAFMGQPYLEKVVLGDETKWLEKGVTYVGKQAFAEATNLKEVYLGDDIETISEQAFYRTAITKIVIPKSCKSIGYHAFSCPGKYLTFEDCSNSIILYGDIGCNNMQDLYLGRPVVYKVMYKDETPLYTWYLKNITFGANNDDWEKDTIINSQTYHQPTYQSVNFDTVRVLRTIPPKAPRNGFSAKSYNNAILFVPKGTIEKYQADSIWGKFVHITDGTIPRIPQKITWEQYTIVACGERVKLTATASSGLPVKYRITDGSENAKIYGVTNLELQGNKPGYATVEAYQSGDDTYQAAESVSMRFTILKRSNKITWEPKTTNMKIGESIALDASASSGQSVSFKITKGENLAEIVETEGKYALKGKGGGSVTVAAFVQSNELYEATDSVFTTFTITKKEQTITWKQDIEIVKGTTLTMQAVSSSGLPVTYTYQDPRPGTFGIPSSISGADIVFDSPGAYVIYANQEGNDEYEAAEPVKMEFNVLDEAYDDLMYIDGIYYRYADDAKTSLRVVRGYKKYESDIVVPEYANSLPVVKIDNNAFSHSFGITSIVIGDNVTSIGDQALALCINMTSITLPPTWSLGNINTLYCSSAIKEVHCKARVPNKITGAFFYLSVDYNTCILYVPRGTKELYAAAEIWKNFMNIVEEGERAEQTLTWTQSKTSLKTGECILLSATASSGLAVTYTIESGADCAQIIQTDSGYVLKALAEGTVTVAASQAGNNAFNAANSVTMLFTITAKKKQVITWEQDIEIAKGTTLTMQAVSSSGLPVTYTYEQQVPTSILGAEIVFGSSGPYAIIAHQEGNDEYEAAEPVKMEFNVLDEAYDDLMYIDGIYYRYADDTKTSLRVVRGYKKYEGDITVPEYVNSLPVVEIDVDAFSNSLGVTSVVIGNNVTSIGDQALAVCTNMTSVTLPPACPLVSNNTLYCSLAIKEIHCKAIIPNKIYEHFFYCSVDYTKCILYVPRGTKELYATAEVWKNFVNIVEEGKRAEQTVTWTQSETALMVDDSLQLSASATSGLTVSYIIVDGNENAEIITTDNGALLHALKAGEVTVAAYQQGNNMYSATDTVTVQFIISAKEKKKQTITWEQNIEIVKGTTLTMQAVSSSGLPVTYTYEHPEGAFGIPTSISGADIVFDYPGAYILYANQEGNDEYEAAEPVKMEFNVLDEAYDDVMYIDGIYYRYADANKNSLMVVSGYKKYEGDIVVPAYVNSLPVVKIDDKAFYASYGITSVVVGDNVTYIGEQAMGACRYLSSVTLPPVCYMPTRNHTFNASPAIKEIHCKATDPYSVDETIFNGYTDYKTCILYVPRGTKALYEQAEVWKNFENIVEEDVATSITPIENDKTYDVYTMQGLKVMSKVKSLKMLPKSIYIVNGKKMVVGQ